MRQPRIEVNSTTIGFTNTRQILGYQIGNSNISTTNYSYCIV